MRPNKLRELLNAGKLSVGTRVHNTWPSIVEAIGHTGMFDYVEFLAEYAPFDLYSLDNFCRAAELYDMSAMIKIDQEPRSFLAQRGIGEAFRASCSQIADRLRTCASACALSALTPPKTAESTVLERAVLLTWGKVDRLSMFRRFETSLSSS